MNDFLAKPVRKQNLEQTLYRWLAPKKKPTNAPPASPSNRTEEVIDAKLFTEFKTDTHEAWPSILEISLLSFQESIQIMAKAVQQRDGDTLSKTAHKLKSSGWQLGAMRLGNLAEKLELAGQTPAMAEAPALFADLEKITVVTMQCLRNHLPPSG